jgi:predicted 3-demethylubiquinone-9 3-methyltransferase (glyoxalase superfamily)
MMPAVPDKGGAATPLPDNIATAAAWLADHWHVAPQPLTRTLREMFGLSFNDAVKAMVEAKRQHLGVSK